MGKRFFAPHTRRCADLPHEPCVYVAELSTGLVKVGTSSSARARLMSLQSEVKRMYGTQLGRFEYVTRKTPKAAYEAETRLVALAESIAQRAPERREFFTGLDFDVAKELLERACDPGDDFPNTETQAVQSGAFIAAPYGLFHMPIEVIDFSPSPSQPKEERPLNRTNSASVVCTARDGRVTLGQILNDMLTGKTVKRVSRTAEPKRAPLDWNKPTAVDRWAGFICKSSTQHQEPRSSFGRFVSPDMQDNGPQTNPVFGSAALVVKE